MKKNLYIFAAAVLLLCALGFRQSSRWEYKYEHAPAEKRANELGAQGWELISIQSPSQYNPTATYVFKRAK